MDTDQTPTTDNAGAEPAEAAGAPEGGERAGGRFDPTPYMRQLRGRGGGGEYLDVKWRLLWLRREHPDAEIVTEHVRIEPTLAIFKATVMLPTGGKATGYGSETAGDFGDFIEKAETKAIGRALNALGYGAQFSEREDEAEMVAPAAPPRPAAPERARTAPPASAPRAAAAARPPIDLAATRERGSATEGRPDAAPTERRASAESVADAGADASARRVAPEPAAETRTEPAPRERRTAPEPAAQPEAEARPERTAAGRRAAPEPSAAAESEAPATPAARRRAAQAGAAAGDEDLADYSWTAFWPWARSLGLNGPKPVEALIGRPTAGLTPAELRALILQARGEG